MSQLSEVYVIDDDAAIRNSLPFLLRTAGIASVAYDSALAFLRDVHNLSPGCIVADVRMPGMDGLKLVRRLAELNLHHPTIVITGHADIPLAVEAMKAGAIDFIEKPFSDEVILKTIRSALNIGAAVPGDHSAGRRDLEAFGALTPRERQVLLHVLAGDPNKVIAHRLDISARTVEGYRANLMMKTGAHSLSALVRLAIEAGL